MIGQHKIIFSGPVGAGKTTAITAISDIPPVSTEQKATDETKDKKEMTTVAMDYGNMRLKNGELIHLYGTPGQKRFDFMWDLLIKESLGIVILIDGSSPEGISDLENFLSSFESFILSNAAVVGVSRMRTGSAHTLENYRSLARKKGMSIPVFEVDPREQNDVIMMVQALLFSLDPGITELSA